ncbi:uncharacterized protein LOC100846363 [Brachypodium distachyon]|uniref:Uncharacterized protein n=1 Tax=Brachypodium distachyon TaxID=15368 RepID=I1GZR0_BRADI|nr:uncharacterized protein LOC100846363 [Brachypodium distachyon]KQK18972.1 hypothetical protein BRADI_1g45680v3 [Brachypodium distachyon]|eukprot:XP_003560913.1 uncharacterized protein LOC100846363 [Brachypodium distachyon]
MYATWPLQLFKSNPKAASWPPPDGGNSGYLVATDGEDEEEGMSCMGMGGTAVHDLPFPQNRLITISDADSSETVLFMPVLDQPLSSNRYYAVIASGRKKGLVRTCCRESELSHGCFTRFNHAEPRAFDPADVYQQMEIIQRRRGQFTARAVAADGFPYSLYSNKYWHARASRPMNYTLDLGEAIGLNAALIRSRQPDDAFRAVGRWYCPFFHVKEGGVSPAEQMKRAAYYGVTLEQRWEEPVSSEKLPSFRALIGGSLEARQESSVGWSGYVSFRAPAGQRVGVSTSVWQRMRFEQRNGARADAARGTGRSVPVERFVLKRTDGSVAVAFDFLRAAQHHH